MSRENGNPHGMAYNPIKNVIYEVNFAKDAEGNDVSLFNRKNKSEAYMWDMGNDLDVSAFWSRENGNNYLLAPVMIKDPAAASEWFQSRTGKSWDYYLGDKNCGDYACKGMNAGGAGINIDNWIRPSQFPGNFTMKWISGSSGPTKIGN